MDDRPAHPPPAPEPREPIAIIGMSCRMPGGAHDGASYWRMLMEGRDAIGDVPPGRWDHSIFYSPDPGRARTTVARQAGFLEDVDRFDPGFFGISPREAAQMDPQQRLLMEVAWEALDDAGLAWDRWRGSPTAVFVGISAHEYGLLQTTRSIGTHTSTGQATSMAANRLSHAFDFRGPSASVDTACSSSLVAIHLACTSLWSGDATMALAGGVNVMISPDTFVGFSNLSMLSPDSRCMAFDTRANGFVRSEGAGTVVLKPLARAREDGDRIHALILATAVNQDGHTPGITVPSEASQEAMLREAYARAGVAPGDVAYVEAHGTGTQVGDLVEARSLGRVLGRGRPKDRPLLVGSAKTNVGHLEAAAGMAGVLKATLALEKGTVPPNLHFETPNPRIDFEGLRLRIPTGPVALEPGDGPLVAGVNSFGFGGTNAHVVLARAPLVDAESAPTDEPSPPFLLPLSARSREALDEVAASFRDLLGRPPSERPPLADLLHTQAVRRTHHPFRLVAAGDDADALRSVLEAGLAGEEVPEELQVGRAPSSGVPPLAFVFTGQGAQWWGMGKELLASEPIFRASVERCDAVVRRVAGWSVMDELLADETASRMDETAVVQPALLALQVGLVDLWRARGVTPDVAVGHSVGEIAAAYAAGVLELEQATEVAVHRGRLMDRASSRGRMLAVGAGAERVDPVLSPFADRVAVAAVNGPASLTLSGEAEALEDVRLALREARVASKYLEVEYAFHSPQMDPIEEELRAALSELEPREATCTLVSTVTGRVADGEEWTADYWWRNLRQAVQFAPAVDTLVELGARLFLEVGPRPTLVGPLRDCLGAAGVEGEILSPLRPTGGDRSTLLQAMGRLYTLGVPVDWSALHPRGKVVPLPRYPWQRSRYWTEDEERRHEISAAPDHPLLGVEGISARPTWTLWLDADAHPYLGDHTLRGTAVFPAAAYLEMASALARRAAGEGILEVGEVEFHAPLFLRGGGEARVETRFHPGEGRFEVLGRPDGEASWELHASGRVVEPSGVSAQTRDRPAEIAARLAETVSGEELYGRFQEVGLGYGPSFRGIQTAHRGPDEALGLVRVAWGEETESEAGYLTHPALLDACLQVILAALPDPEPSGAPRGAYLPTSVRRLRVYGEPGTEVFSHVRLRDFAGDALVADVDVLDAEGRLLVEVTGLRCQAVAGSADVRSPAEKLLYRSRWQAEPLAPPVPDTGTVEPGRWLLLADGRGVAAGLEARLTARGHEVVLLRPDRSSANGHGGTRSVEAGDAGALARAIEAAATGGLPLRGVLHLWPLDQDLDQDAEATSGGGEPMPRDGTGTATFLRLIQALASLRLEDPPRLWLVTRRAQALDASEGGAVSVAQAPLWGLRRVAGFEHPRLRPSAADLGDLREPEEIDALLRELLADGSEDEVLLRGPLRAVHRYVPTTFSECAPDPVRAVAPARHPFHATSRRLGSLDNLRLVAHREATPRPGEVRIGVRAAGLNFADVLKGLGLYPGATTASVTFGAECAGVVTAVGEAPGRNGQRAAHRLAEGQRVVALASHAFGSSVTAPAGYAFPIPDGLSFQQAAGLPVVFLTAQYALRHLGRLRAGERVLIHSATGGVGLAAIQIARSLGCEILATAGNDEKRAHLRALGVEHVMDSRTLAFADEALAFTDGEGVDLVLNSLAGEAIPKGISILRPFGRFIEIGKRDIHENARLGLRPLRDNISFSVLDLDQAIRVNPELVHGLFAEVMEGFATGTLEPLPVTPYPITKMVDAFRYMTTARHIGKIVLELDVEEAEVVFPHEPPLPVAEGTYLVTGGLGGFGRVVARWLAERGAGHLVLVSRRGPGAPEAEAIRSELEERGAQVRIAAVDVTDEDALRDLLDEVRAELPPLRGVVHAAMVLDDGTLEGLDEDRLDRVLRPKVLGAWHLHRLTRNDPLDLFVMTSSVSSILGSPGQGNYAAANAFLDTLAHLRRGRGQPALSLNLGALESVGVVARDAALLRHLATMGIRAVPPAVVLDVLDRILGGAEPQVGVTDFDLPALASGPLSRRLPPRFQELVEASRGPEGEGDEGHLLRLLQDTAPDRRATLLLEALAGELAGVLGTPRERFDPALPLSDLGVDSLMTVELLVWVEEALELRLAAGELMGNPTTRELATLLLDRLELEHGEAEGPAPTAGGASAPRPSEAGLRADARLDPELVPQEGEPAPGHPAHLFLTGGTGFVGVHLIRELLDETGATLHCLVRAADVEEGTRRIREAMETHEVWGPDTAARIVAVPGDLARPRLGLTEEEFQEVGETVGAIYHGGAGVNFLLPYDALRGANVVGTREVIRLACTGRPKTLHHVSSIAVFSPKHHAGVIREETVPNETDGLPDGYSQSKWVAEQLVLQAAERGLPVRVYRPAILTAHTETWVTSSSGVVLQWLLACYRVGILPDLPARLDVTPVDRVVRGLVRIAGSDTTHRIFHLCSPEPTPLAEVVRWLQAEGLGVETLPFPEWRARMEAHAGEFGFQHLMGLIPDTEVGMLRRMGGEHRRFRMEHTLDVLGGTGLEPLAVDPDRFAAYMERLGASGAGEPTPRREREVGTGPGPM